ncbi:hypothetical protein BGW80DRAFT_123644 [Lactifluus volemus]|nr:hypothetical protein BGW80DRAFT_123644 [Lactifluus volemus]
MVTIEAIPDDVLLDIFDFFLQVSGYYPNSRARSWNRLVHVCKRWRYIVFASPLRLDLCLYCSRYTPVRETLDVWPPLPMQISSGRLSDNILAALEHRDRIREVSLDDISMDLDSEHWVTLMQKPIPSLERLSISSRNPPPLSSSFLGGSAPRLQRLSLWRTSLPTLPQLLSSSRDLVYLSIEQIPYDGYISPEAMATCICSLTRLTNLSITFCPTSLASRTRPPSRQRTRGPSPLTCTVLASLISFKFDGDNRYLEYLVAQVEAPVLKDAEISLVDLTLSNSLTFDIESLARFIGHSPNLLSYHRAVVVCQGGVELTFYPMKTYSHNFILTIPCDNVSSELPSMVQICSNLSLLLSGIEQLDIEGSRTPPVQADRDDAKWLEVFRPFTSVQILKISGRVEPHIVRALKRLGEEVAAMVFPALEHLYIEEKYLPPASKWDVGRFITTRQRSDHPVAVHYFEESRYKEK